MSSRSRRNSPELKTRGVRMVFEDQASLRRLRPDRLRSRHFRPSLARCERLSAENMAVNEIRSLVSIKRGFDTWHFIEAADRIGSIKVHLATGEAVGHERLHLSGLTAELRLEKVATLRPSSGRRDLSVIDACRTRPRGELQSSASIAAMSRMTELRPCSGGRSNSDLRHFAGAVALTRPFWSVIMGEVRGSQRPRVPVGGLVMCLLPAGVGFLSNTHIRASHSTRFSLNVFVLTRRPVRRSSSGSRV
jgi:hypothetical protein